MKKFILIILIFLGVLIMLKPVSAIIKDSIGNIMFRGNVVAGIVAKDNGDKSYDCYISESEVAYPKIFTLSANPNLAVGDKVRILYKGGCKELPIILPPTTVAITGEWILPTGHIDLGGSRGWWNETRMYDGSLLQSSNYNVNNASWSNFIRLTHAPMLCNKMRIYSTYFLGHVDIIDIDVYYDDAWHDVYEGYNEIETTEYGNPLEWFEKEIPEGVKTITEFRIRAYNSHPTTDYGCGIFEVEFFEVDE